MTRRKPRAGLLAAGLGLLVGLSAFSSTSQAAPIGFKDSVMTMVDLGPNFREGWLNYAFTVRDAVGAGTTWMRSDDKLRQRSFTEINYTRLLRRLNLPHAQANAWFLLSAGPVTGNDFDDTRSMVAPGLQLDYETTRVYLAGTTRLYRASGLKHDLASVRAGFSFYEVDYDQTQPWLVVEARRMRGLSDKLEITPMLRLINARYFVEFGVNNSRDARVNLMYIF